MSSRCPVEHKIWRNKYVYARPKTACTDIQSFQFYGIKEEKLSSRLTFSESEYSIVSHEFDFFVSKKSKILKKKNLSSWLREHLDICCPIFLDEVGAQFFYGII